MKPSRSEARNRTDCADNGQAIENGQAATDPNNRESAESNNRSRRRVIRASRMKFHTGEGWAWLKGLSDNHSNTEAPRTAWDNPWERLTL